MKRISILSSLAFATCVMADNITVGTTQDLVNATATVKPGDTILLSDGTYRDLRLTITADGTGDKMITIKAQNPGKAYISGNSAIELRGDFIHLSGLYFKDGSRNKPMVRVSSAYMPTIAKYQTACSTISIKPTHHTFLPTSTKRDTYRNTATYTTVRL